jgi:NitT/TauT family transport system substrate-binding protein
MKPIIFSTALLLLLASSYSWGAEKIRVGYSSIGGAYTGIWVAHEAGLFAKEGLDDQMILIPSGSQLAQVAVAGEVDIASLNASSAMAAAVAGADIKFIGNQVNKMIMSMYVRPEIKSVDGLKGKKIGITRFGSATDVSARYALKKYNLDPQKDVTILQMGAMSSIMASLQGGAIDAGLVSGPTQFTVEKLGFKELVSITDMDLPFPNPVLVAQGGVLRKRAELIDKFMRAYARGIHRAKTDKELALKVLARYSRIDDSFSLQKTYDLYVGKALDKAPYIDMAGMQSVLDDLAKTTPAAKTTKLEQLIDLRFVEKLETDGLLKDLYR